MAENRLSAVHCNTILPNCTCTFDVNDRIKFFVVLEILHSVVREIE